MGSGTEIGRVRGLGSAKSGTHHWVNHRITAVSNLFLVLWLIFSLLQLPSLDYIAVTTWLAKIWVAVPMMLMLVSVFTHLRLGLQILVEDYVHDEGLKFATLMFLNFYAVAGAAAGIFAIAKIAFTGAAS
ncbi:succinate dehydrogenase, hydrophobic membrane anchor protein [Sphingobium sp. SCG-1]|uniref:succinate dehydrogenase, hydrophobic membrane anchor protein n=1 Tax=Sphingobium sp. SCG-1 TaxID=2072936 RepID=UPI000CD687F1|nr:succinate dehydrogenase, hydrophobic membrane anchor protein [Sphingobium sp. SCG-1]AUW57625.1 succinate dehydrogenase, hydrophobic membrane anchor protein [Sphingobium sp. SCG-1]